MGCSTDEAIHVIGVNVKVHVYPVNNLIPQYVLYHLFLDFTATVGAAGVLYSRRMPRNVAVFAAADQDNFLKATEMPRRAQLEQECLSEFLTVLHRQLVQTFGLVHLPHKPKPRLDHRVYTVEVPQMRRTQGKVEAHLLLILLEISQGGSCNDTTHAMSYKVDDHFGLVISSSANETFDFLRKFEAHEAYVSISADLVAGGDEEHAYWKYFGELSLDQLHIVGARLESMDQNNQHVPFVVVELFLQLSLTQVRELFEDLLDGLVLEFLGFEDEGEVNFQEGVVLIFLVQKEIFVDYFELVYFALFTHLGCDLCVCLFILGLLAEDDRSKQSLPEDISSFSAIQLFHSLCIQAPLADLLTHFQQEVKVLLVNLINLFCYQLLFDVIRVEICDVIEELLIVDGHQVSVLPQRRRQLYLFLPCSEEAVYFCLEAQRVISQIFDVILVEVSATVLTVFYILFAPFHQSLYAINLLSALFFAALRL